MSFGEKMEEEVREVGEVESFVSVSRDTGSLSLLLSFLGLM